MQQSRGPACFCCQEASKNATVSWSGSFLLSRSLKKSNGLVVRLVFAVWKYEKMLQFHVLVRFCFVEIIFQKRFPGVPPTTTEKWSVLNKIVGLESFLFEACQSWSFGWFLKPQKMRQSRGPARFCCLEASKNATVSWSGSFLLSRSLKKCNSLVVQLVFAV